jgi:hypothetical protein
MPRHIGIQLPNTCFLRRRARLRSLCLAGFTTAMLVALVSPPVGFGLICAAPILHLRPEVRGFIDR